MRFLGVNFLACVFLPLQLDSVQAAALGTLMHPFQWCNGKVCPTQSGDGEKGAGRFWLGQAACSARQRLEHQKSPRRGLRNPPPISAASLFDDTELHGPMA